LKKQGTLIFITGGARCGKSTFAEKLAVQKGGDRVTYIATCQPGDEEMRERVALHRRRRPPAWETVEEPFQVAAVLATVGYKSRVVLIDCLSLLISNYLTGGIQAEENPAGTDPGREKKALEQVEDLIATAGRIPADTIIVSNEVGWGLVPPTPLGRRYRDLLGRANCAVAASAHEVYLVAAGIPLELKSLSRNRLR